MLYLLGLKDDSMLGVENVQMNEMRKYMNLK